MTEVTGFELKHLRRAIGAGLPRMAQLLGLTGQDAARRLKAMENGSAPVDGTVQRLALVMLEGVSTGEMDQLLPELIIGSDMAGEIEHEWVFRTRYPRFLAIVTSAPVDGLACATADQVEWLCVAMWIDEPVDDPSPILRHAAETFRDYTEEASDE